MFTLNFRRLLLLAFDVTSVQSNCDQCILLKALYNFTTAQSTTLCFAAGDYFYLFESKTSLQNWSMAVNRKGVLGFVPSTYVAEEKVSMHFYFNFIEKIIASLGESDVPLIKGQQVVLEQLLDRKRKLRILLGQPNKSSPTQNATLADLGTNLARFWTKAGLGNVEEIPPPIIESDQEAQYKSLVALADLGPKYLRFNPVVGLKRYNDLIQTATKKFTDKETQSEKKSMLLRLKRKFSFKKEPYYVVNEMQCQIPKIKNEWAEIRLDSNSNRNERKTDSPTEDEEIEHTFKIRESENTVDNTITVEGTRGHFEDKQFAEKGIQYGYKELRCRIHQTEGISESESIVNLKESRIEWRETRCSGDEKYFTHVESETDQLEKESVEKQPDSEIKIGREMSQFMMVAPVSMQYAAGNMSVPYTTVDQGPDECEWCEFGILILTIVLLVFVSAMNMFWALYFHQGYALGENSVRRFNFHPSLMTVGLITFSGFSILLYRICRCIRIVYLRLLHALFHVLAVPCAAAGLAAAWGANHHDNRSLAHYSSLHSWLGVVTLSWFGLQSLCGFLSCIMPFIPNTNRMLPMRIIGEIHATCGLLSFVLSVCCCLTGLSENTLEILKIEYIISAEERVFVNLLGLVLITLLLLFLCFTLPRFHEIRVPKDNRIKKYLTNSDYKNQFCH